MSTTFNKMLQITQPPLLEALGKTPSLSDKFNWVLKWTLHNTQDLWHSDQSEAPKQEWLSVLLEDTSVKIGTQTHTNSSDPKHQSLILADLIARRRHSRIRYSFFISFEKFPVMVDVRREQYLFVLEVSKATPTWYWFIVYQELSMVTRVRLRVVSV